MKSLKVIFLFLVSILYSCAPNVESTSNMAIGAFPIKKQAPVPLDSMDNAKAEAIKKHVQTYVDKGQFSGAILVAQEGKVLFKGGFGWAVVEDQVPNDVDTRFLIGSTTKSFTAIALMQLYEQGAVDLDVPVAQYLPNLKADFGEKMTLNILLRMTSGLPNHLERLTTLEEKAITTDEIIAIINTAQLDYEPGTKYSYSNLNYHLLGAIIEKVSGLSYGEFLRQHTFEPLAMHHTGTVEFDTLSTKKAIGYHVANLERTEKSNLTYALGSGNIYSTVEDIYKWDQALYDDNFLSKESKAKAFNGGTEAFGYYGYGFRIREYTRADSTVAKGTLVRHGGMMKGYLANVHRYLDDRVTVIVLGNISMFPIRDLTTELKEIALGINQN